MKNTKYSVPIGLEILKAAAIVAVILGASAALFIAHYSSTQADRLVAESPVVETPAGNLPVMYTVTWCVQCRRAKAYMAQKHIPYREIDVDSADGEAKFRSTGERGVPVLVRGGEHFVGFSEKYYESIFSIPSDAESSPGST